MGSVEFVEAPFFTRRIVEMLPEREYGKLQAFLIQQPEAGDLIPGGRGLRKLRWSSGPKGKRGGIRIIYYLYPKESRIYMIYPYKKSDQEDLTAEQFKYLALYVKGGVL